MAEVRVVKPGEARPWWWQGGIVRWLATGADTEERYACEESLIQPGHGPAPHIQTRARECLYVLSGGPLEFTAGRHEIPLETGGFVSVPRARRTSSGIPARSRHGSCSGAFRPLSTASSSRPGRSRRTSSTPGRRPTPTGGGCSRSRPSTASR